MKNKWKFDDFVLFFLGWFQKPGKKNMIESSIIFFLSADSWTVTQLSGNPAERKPR